MSTEGAWCRLKKTLPQSVLSRNVQFMLPVEFTYRLRAVNDYDASSSHVPEVAYSTAQGVVMCGNSGEGADETPSQA